VTFLNPYVLFGLIAASFPVLFHLFAQRRARRLEFSSVQFLKQLEKNSMRKIKLRQILLPALQGYLGGFPGTSSANSTMVFLMDNSASMSERVSGGSYFKRSTDAAIKLLDIYKEGDEVVIIPLAGFDKEKSYEPLHDKREIVKRLAEMQTADAEADLGAGLRLASAALARSLNINKEVFLFTDGQARNYSLPDSSRSTDSSTIKLFDERTKFYTVLSGAEGTKQRNLSIDSLKSITTIFEPGRQIEFEAFIRNTSSDEVDAGTISLFFNGERVAQKSLDKLAGGETRRFLISALPRTVGSLGVEASLEEDNKRFLALDIPASRTVGLFFDKISDAEFIKLALELTLTESNTLPFKVEYHRLEELRMLPALSRLDAVLVGIGAKLPEDGDINALRDYVTGGRAAAMYLLDGLDAKSFNTAIASKLQTGTIQGKYIAFGDKYAAFTQFDMAHPFFRGMFDNKQQGIESPRFASYYQLVKSGTPIISLSGGGTFLSEHAVGKGSVLLYSASPALDMSDLPRKSVFLPLVRRTVSYVASIKAGGSERENSFYTGAPVELQLQGAEGEQAGSSFVMKSPDGSIRRVISTSSATGLLRLDIQGLSKAGIYTLYRDAEARLPVSAFAVNTRTSESDPNRASKVEMTTYISPYFTNVDKNITYLDASSGDIAKTVSDSRFGVELWQTLLLLALLCAVAEMLIAREGKTHQ
jgi:hypothetical protein